MAEEEFVTRAQGVQPCVARLGGDKAVLRALAVAERAVLAAEALARQCVALGKAELQLPLRPEDVAQGIVSDISEQVFGVDEVVARVDVAVVLYDERLAACLAHGADTRRHVHIVGQRGVEELHEASPDILAHPYVEDAYGKRWI